MLRPTPRWLLPLLGLILALAGCATRAPALDAQHLLHDELFARPAQAFDAKSLFELSPEMQEYLRVRLPLLSARNDPRQALLDALYSQRDLRLAYDGGHTLTAREAFAARSGNCLSLVIMTSAFAKHLGLPVSYRRVVMDEMFTRTDSLTLASGHVNLVLAPLPSRLWRHDADDASLTVDFLPSEETRGQRSHPLEERTLVAMYLNNRAVETLGQGRLDEAYGWAREAVLQDKHFTPAANTLGVIYSRAGHTVAAEAALRHALLTEPDHHAALSNLVGLMTRLGREGEAAGLAARLAQLQPVPPFKHYEQGREAMGKGNFAAARDHFNRELRRQPYQDEVHFWAAQANWYLGDFDQAAHHLRLARDYSITQTNHARYAAKLDHLRAH
jgi:tetratricopeptide (TPR) repeat protein